MLKQIPFIHPIKKNFLFVPLPSNITYFWNFGSMLGFILVIQILTGFLISMHYNPSTLLAFNSYMEISRNLNQGFILKFMHSTGASTFFILIFLHMMRGIQNKSFKNHFTWSSGVTIFLILMASAFMGYVLPWGQMSLWGATVITNLLSTIPIIGIKLTHWLWGGFNVSNPTLNRFFSIHFILPLTLIILSTIHMLLLHSMGSSNNMNLNSNKDKISFKNFFSSKDLTSIILLIILMMITMNSFNLMILDPENFNPANPLQTPNHIMPEWYFLFAYAILRSIPSKLGGVIALASSILILYILPLMKKSNTSKFNPFSKLSSSLKIISFLSLTYLGAQIIEPPYIFLSKMFSFIYFPIMLI